MTPGTLRGLTLPIIADPATTALNRLQTFDAPSAVDNLNTGIGTEWDAQADLVADANLSFLLEYANYQGSGAAFGGFADKSMVWLQTAWKY